MRSKNTSLKSRHQSKLQYSAVQSTGRERHVKLISALPADAMKDCSSCMVKPLEKYQRKQWWMSLRKKLIFWQKHILKKNVKLKKKLQVNRKKKRDGP